MSQGVNINPYPAFFECMSTACRFRFPVLTTDEAQSARTCPRCGSPTLMVEVSQPESRQSLSANHPVDLQPLEVLLDNIRSAHNVGSIFRTADGAGVRHLHLCGVTPTPAQVAVKKTSLDAEKSIPWSYHLNGKLAIQGLKAQNFAIWALETGNDSISLFEVEYPSSTQPILLVVGNEISGIDPGILMLAERKVSIPMRGLKESLNVSNAFSIAAYTICYRLRK